MAAKGIMAGEWRDLFQGRKGLIPFFMNFLEHWNVELERFQG